ncbi:MAG: hypothetical protein HZC36_09870 [Armatimonadetes bacterium]|nr:hypothetical protein [Armatimonadota bacterium]
MTDLSPISEIQPGFRRVGRGRKPTPDDDSLSERDQLVLELVHFGISLRKAESLVSGFPEDLIRKQLRWLPMRAARRPASLLIASIEHDYDAPAYANDE